SVSWRRASEGALAPLATQDESPPAEAEVFKPSPMGGASLQGALAALRSVHRDPRELLVWREPEAGIYGVRFFKDGEWMYEILDDFLPVDASGQPICSIARSQGNCQDWVSLIEKAYAKVHGSYEAIALGSQAEALEAIALGSEAEALEDVLGIGAGSFAVEDFPIWGELWQHLKG
ncbi:unnamed protein product, partial [Polarella glacialis]